MVWWCLEFFEESSRFVTFRLKNDSIEWRGKKKTKKPHLKWNVCVHHVFHCIRINVEVKILRDFLLFFSIIQGHRCINRFNFQLQPAFKKIFRRYSPFFLSFLAYKNLSHLMYFFWNWHFFTNKRTRFSSFRFV